MIQIKRWLCLAITTKIKRRGLETDLEYYEPIENT